MVTDNIAGRDKRLAVLADKQAGLSGQIAASITLDELERMQREAADIPVSDAANELADDILCQLRKDGTSVSDRKYLNYYPIAQAKAWLSGHAQVEPQDLLALVRKSPVLKDISKYLGRFREIFAQGKRNGCAYGRGEKYSLELGRDLSRAITSELAMLASPQTTPLFLRKYQRGQIKQYQRREPIYRGMGDIICCEPIIKGAMAMPLPPAFLCGKRGIFPIPRPPVASPPASR